MQDEGDTSQRQVSDAQLLREANEELANRAHSQAALEQQLQEARERSESLMRSGAKRLVQIATLEQQLEDERGRSKRLTDELVKQTKMMDLVINFRDQECAREVNELTHDNTELAEKLDVWKERAQMLQQERWGFVQKFRAAKAQAGEGGNAEALDGASAEFDDDDDDDDEPAEGGSDDDW